MVTSSLRVWSKSVSDSIRYSVSFAHFNALSPVIASILLVPEDILDSEITLNILISLVFAT